jgi:hypothetical protein
MPNYYELIEKNGVKIQNVRTKALSLMEKQYFVRYNNEEVGNTREHLNNDSKRFLNE